MIYIRILLLHERAKYWLKTWHILIWFLILSPSLQKTMQHICSKCRQYKQQKYVRLRPSIYKPKSHLNDISDEQTILTSLCFNIPRRGIRHIMPAFDAYSSMSSHYFCSSISFLISAMYGWSLPWATSMIARAFFKALTPCVLFSSPRYNLPSFRYIEATFSE